MKEEAALLEELKRLAETPRRLAVAKPAARVFWKRKREVSWSTMSSSIDAPVLI